MLFIVIFPWNKLDQLQKKEAVQIMYATLQNGLVMDSVAVLMEYTSGELYDPV